ncbi:MAG TPA: 50S ribosomal protein L11 methyltransferase [Abditibacteriaceae bacterium]
MTSDEYSTAATDWLQVRVTVDCTDAELCAQTLLDSGSAGAQIDDTQVLLDESEDATLAAKSHALVTGYLPSSQHHAAYEEQLRDNLRRLGIAAQIDISPLPPQDWEAGWKQNFPPLRIGRFLIAPPWESVEESEAIVIRLDPGLAFGTGQHPTTHMCLELLGEQLEEQPNIRVLDVGCGSGILSIAANKLGATVFASDLDRFCVDATRDNTRANDAVAHIVQAAGLSWTTQPFDLVVANLMSALLISLAPQLAGATRDGGTLVVSGISAPRADDVEAALQAAGFATLHKREQDGDQRGDYTERWTAFVMRKTA